MEPAIRSVFGVGSETGKRCTAGLEVIAPGRRAHLLVLFEVLFEVLVEVLVEVLGMLKRGLVLTLSTCLAVGLLYSSAAYAVDESEYTLLTRFPDNLTTEYVAQLAAEAFVARKWTLKSHSQGRVVGTLDHRGIDATLELKILGDRIVYFCDCRAKKKRRGQSTIEWKMRPLNLTALGWVNNLRKDLQRSLGDPNASSAKAGAR